MFHFLLMLMPSFVCAIEEAGPRDQILELVRKSAMMAAAQDKTGWIDLFAPSASVEDPVGTGAMVGHEAIGHFYDALLAKTSVNFSNVLVPEVVIGSMQCTSVDCHATVVRWVDIKSTFFTGFIAKLDAILVYEVIGSPTGLQIASLQTYWSQERESQQFLHGGFLGFKTAAAMAKSLLDNLGARGAYRFAQGAKTVGSKGEATMQQVVNSINSTDFDMFQGILSKANFQMPHGTPVPLAGAWSILSKCHCTVSGMETAGRVSIAALKCALGEVSVLRLTFDGIDGNAQPVALEGFWDDGASCGSNIGLNHLEPLHSTILV